MLLFNGQRPSVPQRLTRCTRTELAGLLGEENIPRHVRNSQDFFSWAEFVLQKAKQQADDERGYQDGIQRWKSICFARPRKSP